MRMIGRPVLLALVLLAGAGGLASDSYAQATSVVVLQPSQRVYTSPEGRYELRGDGTASSPYYWVWIPTGVQAVPAPPPLPSIVQPSQPAYGPPPPPAIVQPSQRAFTYSEGRYELRGDGTASSPYYWIWIPAGAQWVPTPPPISTIVQPTYRVYTYPEGRYELRGDGTASSPHSWVWIPAGTMSQIPALKYPLDLRSVEGQVESIGLWGTSIMLGGRNFEFPDSFAMSNTPGVGQHVMVTYYVAQDGRHIVRSLDPISAR